MTRASRQGHAPRLYVFSGAGLSAESGISTFRTGDGLWTKESIDEVCNLETFRRNRTAIFRFYNERITEGRKVRPNAAHEQLAKWQNRWGCGRVRLMTQNFDDLLERAGARSVTHLHGDLASLTCIACEVRFPRKGETLDPAMPCPECGQVETVKPGVVFFNEMAPEYEKLRHMQHEMTNDDLFIAVGTAFEVITPEQLLSLERHRGHPRSFLVDPVPRRARYFGVIESKPATAGLRNIAGMVERMMDAR